MTSTPLHHYQIEYAGMHPVLMAAAAYNFPLNEPRDYMQIAAFQTDARAPVLLHHRQYFDFLSRLADGLWKALGERARLFVQLRMPFVGSLPENLLLPNITLGANLFHEAAFWAEHGGGDPVVWIADRIRRDLDYPEGNFMTCAVWPASLAPELDALLVRPWPEHAITIVKSPPMRLASGEAVFEKVESHGS